MKAKALRDKTAAELRQQEQEIANGHGEFRYGGYLTVSAPDEERLDQAIVVARVQAD